MKIYSLSLILLLGFASKPTPFALDYAALRPRIEQCARYDEAHDTARLYECLSSIAPLANKVVVESNDGDDSRGLQNIAANLMAARLNWMEFDLILQQNRSHGDSMHVTSEQWQAAQGLYNPRRFDTYPPSGDSK